MTFYARTALPAAQLGPALRREVRKVDPNLPVFDMKTMAVQVGESLFTERMVAILSAFFGLLATVLAAVGLYGVMAYTVTRRTKEIGIRVAVGAGHREVLWLVMREVCLLAVTGIGIGAPAAFALSKLIRSQLFGIEPNDPLTLALAISGLCLIALLAGFIPAARAARVDPISALRYE
jgi:ABC-type antimicrobial peptide transport system permease subunit